MEEENNTVLIAEDNPTALKIITRVFSDMGCQTILATDGAECLHLLYKNKISLLVLDYMLPLLDGLEVLERARKLFPKNILPIMMLTAKGDKHLLEQAVFYGVNDFITKPIQSKEFAQRAKNHMFKLSPTKIMGLLSHLRVSDASSLSNTFKNRLEKESLDPFPVDYGGMKLCILVKKGQKPKQLMSLNENDLADNVTVLGKPGLIWNEIWPNKGHSSLDAEDEWKDYS